MTPASAMWKSSFDALAIVDDRRCYKRVNPATEALFRAPAGDIVEQRIDDFTPDDLRSVLYRLWGELLRRGRLDGPYEMVDAAGGLRVISFRAVRFKDEQHLIVARAADAADSSVDPDAAARAARLTVREREILQLAAHGHTTPEIAELLVLSGGTVKTHFDHIRGKLGVRDRASAVATGIRSGVIH